MFPYLAAAYQKREQCLGNRFRTAFCLQVGTRRQNEIIKIYLTLLQVFSNLYPKFSQAHTQIGTFINHPLNFWNKFFLIVARFADIYFPAINDREIFQCEMSLLKIQIFLLFSEQKLEQSRQDQLYFVRRRHRLSREWRLMEQKIFSNNSRVS